MRIARGLRQGASAPQVLAEKGEIMQRMRSGWFLVGILFIAVGAGLYAAQRPAKAKPGARKGGKQAAERARLLVTVASDVPKAGGRGGGIWPSALTEPVVTSPGEFASAPARSA